MSAAFWVNKALKKKEKNELSWGGGIETDPMRNKVSAFI